jgi:hypothetical protein
MTERNRQRLNVTRHPVVLTIALALPAHPPSMALEKRGYQKRESTMGPGLHRRDKTLKINFSLSSVGRAARITSNPWGKLKLARSANSI